MTDTICYHEHQILGPGLEAEKISLAAAKCRKNPGHEPHVFIPVCDLTKDHLLAWLKKDEDLSLKKDEDLLELIKVTADLTVRLRVRCTSCHRPEITREDYDAKDGDRYGSGFIYDVNPTNQPCQCSDCRDKPEPSLSFCTLKLSTAQHVVFNDEEAEKTTVHLFYDSEESFGNETVKSVYGGKVKFTSDNESDRCRLVFTTCDEKLGARLRELHDQRLVLWDKMKKSYKSGRTRKIVWIASHPHGMPKRVTFGEIKDSQALGRGFFKYSYSAQTCRGSSGAAVCEIGSVECFSWSQLRREIYHEEEEHKGPVPEVEQNATAVGRCARHPGHENFKLMREFTKEDLPTGYQDDEDLFKFIKVTADMTVRLRVYGSSKPADGTSPSTSDGENHGNCDYTTRYGTGMIWEVYTKEPHQSSSPALKPEKSKKGWECTVMTSNRVQFGDGDIWVDLFYDVDEKHSEEKVVTMKGELDKKYVGPDNSRLFFETYDVELVAKLEELKRRRERLAQTLRDAFDETCNLVDDTRNLVWMVSHPHGMAKRVAFGGMEKETSHDRGGTRYRNTTDVCPGCNGAAVWWLHSSTLLTQAPSYLPHHSRAETTFNTGYY